MIQFNLIHGTWLGIPINRGRHRLKIIINAFDKQQGIRFWGLAFGKTGRFNFGNPRGGDSLNGGNIQYKTLGI